MGNNDNIQADINYTSSTISSLIRYMGFMLIGTYFLLFTSESGIITEIFFKHKMLIFACGILGCITIILDLFQYIVGYKNSIIVDDSDKWYYSKNYLYRIRNIFFISKILTSISGWVILVIIFVLSSFAK